MPPSRKALISSADAFGPITETIASELPTSALFNPAFDSCPARTDVTNAVPPTFNPEAVAIFKDFSSSSPFHKLVANAIIAVTPNADFAATAPLAASYVIDSTVPAFAIFLACS